MLSRWSAPNARMALLVTAAMIGHLKILNLPSSLQPLLLQCHHSHRHSAHLPHSPPPTRSHPRRFPTYFPLHILTSYPSSRGTHPLRHLASAAMGIRQRGSLTTFITPKSSRFEMEDFSAELRERTTQQHTAANAIVNLSVPIAMSSPKVYRVILAAFYWVFKALEEETESCRRQYPKISPMYFREILRTRKFEKDLEHYYGPQFRTLIGNPTPATAEYVRYMREAIDRDPVVLIAYCQTMYMGMFGGGVLINKWVRAAFKQPQGVGTAIFDFSDTIDDVSAFKKQYYDALNRISLSRQEKDRIIEMKKKIFEMNNTIVEEFRQSRVYSQRVKYVSLRLALLILLTLLIIYYFASRMFGAK